jgi:ParB family chromosome partitioning protein
MTKRKIFGISQSLGQGMTETINAVKNNAGSFRFEIISLARIEVDPENPRELSITNRDILNGISKDDPQYDIKKTEYSKLESLAETIKKKGLINPIVVYKNADKYRLIAGERRYLASLMAQKEDVQTRILNEKPGLTDLRLLQWIENTEREDLSLKDRIGNINAILRDCKKEHQVNSITATLIKDLIGISLPQATCYLAIINAPPDVIELINNEMITNLDKAAFLSKIVETDLRKKATELLANGASLKELKIFIDREKALHQLSRTSNTKNGKRGRVANQVTLGTTKNIHVIKTIVHSVFNLPQFNRHLGQFTNINWDSCDQATQVFKQFIKILELECRQ